MLFSAPMNRISWKSNKPTEYEFLLSEDGVLFYRNEKNIKGTVQLNENISIKMIDLKITSKKAEAIKVIRIKRTKDIFIYIWNKDQYYYIIYQLINILISKTSLLILFCSKS